MKVIPKPQLYIHNEGVFSFDGATFLEVEKGLLKVGKLFNDLVEKCLGYTLCAGEGRIKFVLEPSFDLQRYKIVITSEYLIVYCGGEQGGFYAVSTLRQLFELDLPHTKICSVNCCIIDDSPHRFYRGCSLDIVRHWFGKEHIIRFIDSLAFLKFNTLHLHFSDDQGYRIESTKYPLLNEISSWRKGTNLRNGTKQKFDETRYGGYLTKAEIKEIVEYASSRGITVIPELDIPGHTVAILAAYPDLSCKQKTIDVRCGFGISKDILCAGNDDTYAFICNLLDEICEMFPSRYIHLGGDEAPRDNWEKCPKCRKKMKELNVKDYSRLQTYMFNFFAEYLAGKNRIAIGWNECLSDDLDESVVVQHWTVPQMRSNKPTVNHINNGRQAIISCFTATYLDYPYAMTPLRKVYSFDPVLKGVLAIENILGVECNIWCEYIRSERKFDYNVYPRIAAFAENAWSQELDYEDFVIRLADYYKILDSLGIRYAQNTENKGKDLKTVYRFFTKNADIEIEKEGTEK